VGYTSRKNSHRYSILLTSSQRRRAALSVLATLGSGPPVLTRQALRTRRFQNRFVVRTKNVQDSCMCRRIAQAQRSRV